MKEKSVENSRMAIRIRCEMVKEVNGNFKDKHSRKGEIRPSSVMTVMVTMSRHSLTVWYALAGMISAEVWILTR